MRLASFTVAFLAALLALLTAAPVAGDVIIEDFRDNDDPSQPGFDPAFNHELTGHWDHWAGGLALWPATDVITFNLPPGSVVQRAETSMDNGCPGEECTGVEFIGTEGSAMIWCPQGGELVASTDGYTLGDIYQIRLQSFEGMFFYVLIDVVPPDCNGNGVPDDQDIADGTSTDANGNGVLDECEGDGTSTTIEDLDQGETAIIVPGGGGFDPVQRPAVIVTNVSGPDDASVTVGLADIVLPDYPRFEILGGAPIIEIEHTMDDGQVFTRVMTPFTAEDLGGQDWPPTESISFVYGEFGVEYITQSGEGNTAAGSNPEGYSPGGNQTIQGSAPPDLGDELGEHGVFWNPDLERGFVWANVDYAGIFGAGINHCPADTNVDGVVDVDDLVNVILAWGTGGLAVSTVYTNVTTEGSSETVVDVDDLLAVVLAWGGCPQSGP